jgi:hypothetical protein
LRRSDEISAQERPAALSERQTEATSQFYEHISEGRKMELVNLIKIHDRVAVHTQKPGGIEEFVQLRQALADDVILRTHVNPHQVSG